MTVKVKWQYLIIADNDYIVIQFSTFILIMIMIDIMWL